MTSNGKFICAGVGLLVVLFLLVFVFISNNASKLELISQRLDSVADRQKEIAKPIDINVRQEDTLDAIDSLRQDMYVQFYHLSAQLKGMDVR